MPGFDLVIRNGRIIDGSGNPWYRADIGIRDGKIAYIGKIAPGEHEQEVDAAGRVVSPGFVDMHGHSDGQILQAPDAANIVEQGITTEIGGMCGVTRAPVSEKYFSQLVKYAGSMTDEAMQAEWSCLTSFGRFLDRVSELPLGTNLAAYVGHGTVRIAVMGFENRHATPEELDEMKQHVREAMESGAIGLSSGLIYPPGVYSPTEELIELSKIVAEYGGSYCSHIRNESDDVVNAVQEAIRIGRESGASVVISHHKIAGKHNWGLSETTLRIIEEANAEGVVVGLDQYPYEAGGTGLKSTIPGKYHEGGAEKLLARLRDPQTREEIKQMIMTPGGNWENLALGCGFNGIMVFARNIPGVFGITVAEYAAQKGMEPLEAMLDLVLLSEGTAGAIYSMMGSEDIERIMKHPYTMIGTDGGIIDPGYDSHPRSRATFPKVLGVYVREKQLLTLEDAIRKMTSLPAQKAGLKTKGLIREGLDADLVIFDPATVAGPATYANPHLSNVGIDYVLVNGGIAVKDSKYTGNGYGKVVRRSK
ncbi:MAG: D-aminoacylase [Firmicutes bacterium]|nr:D-aminoacylase [candidate division NPL-UPA2 bacterium]MBT9156480.1 D-aminoacylase [candidate division NPL-UPA2 bacterium]